MNLGQSLLEYEKSCSLCDEPIAQMIEELIKRPDITSKIRDANTAINNTMLDLYKNDNSVFSVRFERGKWLGTQSGRFGKSVRYGYESLQGMLKAIEEWARE
jgi:hypothetical protein